MMDQTNRMMGTYTIDANGNIIPQNNAGENLLAATLVAGQKWTEHQPGFGEDDQEQDQVSRSSVVGDQVLDVLIQV
jgi:hypothetical protein